MGTRSLFSNARQWVLAKFERPAGPPEPAIVVPDYLTFPLPNGKSYGLSIAPVDRDDYLTAIAASGGQDAAWRLLMNWIRPGEVMFDLGANIGVFAIPATMLEAHVHAFELLPTNIPHLVRAVERNGLKNLTIVQGALSDTNGFAGIGGINAHGLMVPSATLMIPTVVLDDYVRLRNVDRVDVMKIDIEGSERAALAGAKNLIERDHPDIVIESNVWTCGTSGYSYRELLGILIGYGYRLYRINNDVLCPYDHQKLQEVIVADYFATARSDAELAERSVLRPGHLTDDDVIANIEKEVAYSTHHRQYALAVLPRLPATVSAAPRMTALMAGVSSATDENIWHTLATGSA